MANERHRSELHRKQRAKNLAVLVVLLGAVVIIYFVALVRMGGG
jgi:hypothetical protein